jgi:two-component system sensor histidine kinase ChvG
MGKGRKFSSLTFKILGVNLGAIFMLAFGFLYTAHYEQDLINAELSALSKEAQLISAAISEGGVRETLDEKPYLARDLAQLMVRKISTDTDFRILLYNNSGLLVADSHQLVSTGGVVEIIEIDPPPHMVSWHVLLQKNISGYLGYLPTRLSLPLFPGVDNRSIQKFPNLIDTLQGTAHRQAWHTAEDDIMLTVAQPVARLKQVLGAVMLIRTGDRIDTAIQNVQMNVLRVFLGTLAITIFLSLYLSTEIVSPIRELSQATDKIRFRRKGDMPIPDMTNRHDEIGDLSFALREMTAALNARLQAIESFAADVAHELKNPLASVRSAVETLPKITDIKKRDRLLEIIQQDVQRLDRLISDISAASRLDAELSRFERAPVHLDSLLNNLANNYRDRDDVDIDISFTNQTSEDRAVIYGDEGRLGQVFSNLIDNALSFAKPGTEIKIGLERQVDTLHAWVENEGPAIPESKLETIFSRFYTERPDGAKFGTHSGLGLSISSQIIAAHNSRIWAENRPDDAGKQRFVRFTVVLPAYG